MKLTLESVRGRVAVGLKCDGRVVGELSAFDVDTGALTPRCARALRSLSRSTGLDLTPYVVHFAKLPEELRGTGVGTAMYLAAAEGAARLQGALVQHACFYDPELENTQGTTSELARHVWKGARFRHRTRVHGGAVAYMPQAHWGAADAMLEFGQIEVAASIGAQVNPTRTEFGPALRHVMRANEAYTIIDSFPAIRGTDWMSGSCMVLAVALKRWYPGFRYVGIASGAQVYHVLVACGKLYYDAEGSSTKKQLTKRWRTENHLKDARVLWLDTPIIRPQGSTGGRAIECPAAAVLAVEEYIRRALGSPHRWNFPAVEYGVAENPHRLSGATAYCADRQGARVCYIETDEGRPVNAVQVRQLVMRERYAA